MPNWWINKLYLYHPAYVTTCNVSIGVVLLLFPLFGLIANVYLTRYKILQPSLLMLVFILVVSLMFGMAANLAVQFLNHYSIASKLLPVSIITVSAITSIGVFEANAIQFGMDQLLEASSDQLSAFVHQYLWATHLGQQVVIVTAVIVTLIGGLFFQRLILIHGLGSIYRTSQLV